MTRTRHDSARQDAISHAREIPLPPLTREEQRHQDIRRRAEEAAKEDGVRIGEAIKKAVHEALEAAKEKSNSED